MSILQFLFRRDKRTGREHKPRLGTRLDVIEPVRVRLADGSERPAILQDVSSGGAALRTHQCMRVGEDLELWMHLGPDQRYELRARVVYARPGVNGFHARYGVCFLELRDDERFKLDTFVHDRISANQFGVRAFAAS